MNNMNVVFESERILMYTFSYYYYTLLTLVLLSHIINNFPCAVNLKLNSGSLRDLF